MQQNSKYSVWPAKLQAPRTGPQISQMTDGRNPGMSTDELLVRGIVCAKLPQTACMKSPQCKLLKGSGEETVHSASLPLPAASVTAIASRPVGSSCVRPVDQTDVPRCKIAAAV
ncbi:hypothetical protein PG996_001897 [Apiospora saccharicola]|uniref:Uncharacterized protein n=1 Tax=Apiospora saccharicola TaxID=335842 RepID=A0ABR1WHW4_9PEZI